MPTYRIITLGCKVNQQESEALSTRLKKGSWRKASPNHNADVCIINTCTVTGKASMQSRQEIRKAIKANPGARIIVTGCYAQTAPDDIKSISGVHHILGNAFKLSLPESILSSDVHKTDRSPALKISNMMKENRFQTVPAILPGERTRPFLKIQDGCDAFCTYCIVPYARGKSRSMTKKDIMHHLRLFNRNGVREAVLTGIHLGCYGQDLDPENGRLFDLLYAIDSEKVLDRIRLSSIEPHELTDDIIKLVASSDIICPHFHVPLQSGDDMVLTRMHRPYTRDLFRNLIHKIKHHLPDAAIGVDVMAGFPGEKEGAFNNTLRLIEELPVSYLHVFPFSPREGTPAATYPDQISPGIIKKRCHRLREVGNAKRSEFYKSAIGKKTALLVETKRDSTTGFLKGLSPNYIPVLLQGEDHLMSQIVNMTVDRIDDDLNVYGSLLSTPLPSSKK